MVFTGQPRSQGLFPGLGAGREKLFKEIPTRRSTDKNFGSLEETATLKVPVNLEHSRYLVF